MDDSGIEDIYASPQTAPQVVGPNDFHDLSWKQLRTLRNDSHSIRAIGYLLGLLFLGTLGALFFAMKSDDLSIPAAVIGIGLQIATIWICFKRPRHGYLLGLLLCVLLTVAAIFAKYLLFIIFGVAGAVAFGRGRSLFGPDAPRHGDIDREYKHRKKNKIRT